MPTDPGVEAEHIEVALLLQAIYAKYGYDLRGYRPLPMQRRVRALVTRTGVAHLGELQHRVLHDPEFFGSSDALLGAISDNYEAAGGKRRFDVLIYFGAKLRERVLGTFAQGLRRRGFLCLGASESLPDSQMPAFGEFDSLERIYRRGDEPSAR